MTFSQKWIVRYLIGADGVGGDIGAIAGHCDRRPQ